MGVRRVFEWMEGVNVGEVVITAGDDKVVLVFDAPLTQ